MNLGEKNHTSMPPNDTNVQNYEIKLCLKFYRHSATLKQREYFLEILVKFKPKNYHFCQKKKSQSGVFGCKKIMKKIQRSVFIPKCRKLTIL